MTVSLAQGAVHDAEADVADPVFVRSTIGMEQFCVEISRVGHFRRHALKPRLLELAVSGSSRLIDSESAAIVVYSAFSL